MGFFKNIVNGLYKFAFGVDLNKQQRYIDTLESQVAKLKKQNSNLKEELKVQKELLHECNSNLQRLLQPLNKLIEFRVYFGVNSRKNNTTTSFEYTFRGIVPKYYEVDDIAEEFTAERRIRGLLDLFKITWLDYNDIVGISKSGFDSRLIEDTPTIHFDVALNIDGIDIMYPSQKIDNDYRE